MTKRKAYLPLYIGIAIALGIFIGSTFNFNNNAVLFSSNSKEAKIKRLINFIQYDYVDKVNTDSLLDDAITTMLAKLDPHSVYIPKDELQSVTESMQGKFAGIGVSFLIHEDSVAVSSVIKGGPSEKAGIKAGDRILVANTDTLFGKSFIKKAGVAKIERGTIDGNRKMSDAVMKALKGEPNTKVNVLAYRRSVNKKLNFAITRGDVSIKSVSAHYMINNTLGYIKVDRFARTTYDEFKQDLDELISKGMTSLALDLRGNPGGYMDISNKIVDEFLSEGKLIVFTKSKNGAIDKSFATDKGDFEHGKIYVLIDQNSASASEIVAGALRDRNRATLVGETSFGKGSIQEAQELANGSGIHITTAKWLLPSRKWINGTGLEPDIKQENDDKKPDTDLQLEKAIEILLK